jgi:hypothetical protein
MVRFAMARTPQAPDAETFLSPPPLPGWARNEPRVTDTEADTGAAFQAGAALAMLDGRVRAGVPFAGVWRRRLALKAAAASARIARRGEDEATLKLPEINDGFANMHPAIFTKKSLLAMDCRVKPGQRRLRGIASHVPIPRAISRSASPSNRCSARAPAAPNWRMQTTRQTAPASCRRQRKPRTRCAAHRATHLSTVPGCLGAHRRPSSRGHQTICSKSYAKRPGAGT